MMNLEEAQKRVKTPSPYQAKVHSFNPSHSTSVFLTDLQTFLWNCSYIQKFALTPEFSLKKELDTVTKMAIEFRIEGISVKDPKKHRISWPSKLAHQVVKILTIMCGTETFDSLDSRKLDQHHSRIRDESQRADNRILIGDVPQMTTPASYLPPIELIINLPFFFAKNVSNPLFVKEMSEHNEVKLINDFNDPYKTCLILEELRGEEWVPIPVEEGLLNLPSDHSPKKILVINGTIRSHEEEKQLKCAFPRTFFYNSLEDCDTANVTPAGSAITISMKNERSCKALVWVSQPIFRKWPTIMGNYTNSYCYPNGTNPTSRVKIGKNEYTSNETEYLFSQWCGLHSASECGYNIIPCCNELFLSDADVGMDVTEPVPVTIHTEPSDSDGPSAYQFYAWMLCSKFYTLYYDTSDGKMKVSFDKLASQIRAELGLDE